MRLAALALFTVLTPAAFSQMFVTKAFADQDFYPKEWQNVEKYGLSESQMIKMGHDAFVRWYCQDTRAGKSGRIDAEKVYVLALGQATAPLLLALDRKEQKFIEETLSLFADLAKSSFVAGIRATEDDERWSLPVAESSTIVAESIYTLVAPKATLPNPSRLEMEPLYVQVNQRIQTRQRDDSTDGFRLKFLVGEIEKVFASRSPRDKRIAKSFTQRMLKLALSSPAKDITR